MRLTLMRLWYYYLKDHQGSVLALTDEEGAVAEQYRYDAWGRVSVYDGAGRPLSESAVGNRYLWQGREYSWATGLYYFRARWYDPITGRWLSKDPIGLAGGMNLYVFCHNDPVNCIDPLGLDADKDSGGESSVWHYNIGRYSEDWARITNSYTWRVGEGRTVVTNWLSLQYANGGPVVNSVDAGATLISTLNMAVGVAESFPLINAGVLIYHALNTQNDCPPVQGP